MPPISKKLLLTKHTSEPRMILAPCPTNISSSDAVKEALSSIFSLFKQTPAHHERLIYALCGHVFTPSAPPPHGGPRLKPGYINYCGQTAEDLLEYMVSSSFEMYWYCKDKKVLEFIAVSVNKVLALQYRNVKDALDERLLQGLKRAGHIEWHGAAVIPEYLCHVPNPTVAPSVNAVEFTPKRKLMLEERNLGATYGQTPANTKPPRKRSQLNPSNSYAASRPPRIRMLVSNKLTYSDTFEKSRVSRTSFFAASYSSFIPIMYRVSRESTGVFRSE